MRIQTLLLALMLATTPLMAQRKVEKAEMTLPQFKNVIKGNPITLAFGDFNVTWENVLNNKNSMTYTLNLITGSFVDDVTVFALTVGYKYYFTNRKMGVPEGFYVRPIAGVLFGDGDFGARIGGQLGYQWIWNSGFVLDLGLGPQFIFADSDYEGPVPSLFIGIGYAF